MKIVVTHAFESYTFVQK